MTSTAHRQADEHQHTHGPDCGHEAVIREDHVDYGRGDHLHHQHEGPDDECARCQSAECQDSCANCSCDSCTCATGKHAA